MQRERKGESLSYLISLSWYMDDIMFAWFWDRKDISPIWVHTPLSVIYVHALEMFLTELLCRALTVFVVAVSLNKCPKRRSPFFAPSITAVHTNHHLTGTGQSSSLVQFKAPHSRSPALWMAWWMGNHWGWLCQQNTLWHAMYKSEDGSALWLNKWCYVYISV